MVAVRAQNTISPERGFHPSASYAIGDIETISTTSGNLMLHVPLGALPAGRGGLSAKLNLLYNSKLYDINTIYEDCPRLVPSGIGTVEPMTPPYPECTADNSRMSQILGTSQDGGWRYGYKYQLRLVGSFYRGYNTAWGCNPQHSADVGLWKLQIVFPDGGVHDFRLQTDKPEPDSNQLNFFPMLPTGEASQYSSCEGWASTNGKVTYYSVDGTYMRLEFEHDNVGGWSDNQWTLYMPDGTRVTGGNAPQRIYDRNNNYIEIQDNITYNNHPAAKLIDQLGRALILEYNSAPYEDTVHMRSVDNLEINYRVKWKAVRVNKTYHSGAAGLRPNVFFLHGVVDKVILPGVPGQSTELSYTFGYNGVEANDSSLSAGWGEVNSVTLPSGAQVTYQYKMDNASGSTAYPHKVLENAPTRKELKYQQDYDGTSTLVTEAWTYNINHESGVSTITAPDGGITTERFYSESGLVPTWQDGLVYQTETPDGTIVERKWATNSPYGFPSNTYAYPTNTYVKTEYRSIKDASNNYQTAVTDYNYNKNGSVTRVAEYDYVPYASVTRDANNRPTSLPSSAPKRVTVNSYTNATADASNNTTNDAYLYSKPGVPQVLNALEASEVGDGTQTLTRTEFYYDNATTPDPLTAQSHANLTGQRSWDSTKGALSRPLTPGNSLAVFKQFDSYGNPTLLTDARGFQTQYTYGSVGGFTDLYPTETKTALNRPEQRTTAQEYDLSTGLVIRTTDVDNNVSSSTTYDILGRATLVKAAENKPEETRTQTIYGDVERRVIVRSDLNALGDGKLVSIQHYDQLGRLRLSRQLEDSATQSETDETAGIKVQKRYLFSGSNSYQITSNPYRAAYSSVATAETTMGWTRNKVNNGGRVVEVQTFDGYALPAPWGVNTNSTGTVTTFYDGMYTTVADQSGKVRRSKFDALGRLVRIDEPADINNPTNLGSVDAPLQPTAYTYDALSNLTLVRQGGQLQGEQYVGGQTRNFQYGSFSHLLSATQPESGTISYLYDENGNLKVRTDARGISTTYTYDGLNRVTFRDYSDETPDVTCVYDTLANGKGSLTSISSSASTYSYTGYDALGRITGSSQTTEGQTFAMPNYQYDRANHLISQTSPSGRVIATEYDNAGRLSGVKQNNGNYYVGAAASDASNRLQYSAHGAVTALRLGSGLWEHTAYNSRLQATQIGLGSSTTNSTIWQLDYAYGTSNNNGNLQSQLITVPSIGGVSGYVATQSYGYDQLNRLTVAQENNGASWKQTFVYDQYGNRRLDTSKDVANHDKTTPEIAGPNPVLDPTTNRITPQASEAYHFDAVGNLDRDRTNNTYTYDAENRLVRYNNGDPNLSDARYSYDGDGRRVKKIFETVATICVYNVLGQLVAEYSSSPELSGSLSYLTSDALGTPRVITGAGGAVVARHDYLPFGEEISAGVSGRTPNQGYGQTDGVKQKFTGSERDNETGLDFMQARYYGSTTGRFTSPDPLLNSGRPVNPASWNRYSYSLNNPLRFIDPSGLYEYEASATKKQRERFESQLSAAKKNLGKIAKRYRADSPEYIDAQRAINAFGDPNQANGVIVAFGATVTGKLGETVGGTSLEAKIKVTIDINSVLDNGDLSVIIAHEGSHVQDRADYLSAFTDAYNTDRENANGSLSAVVDGPLNLTSNAGETRAYGVSSVFAEMMLKNESAPASGAGRYVYTNNQYVQQSTSVGGVDIWNPSWAKLDINRIRQTRSSAIASGLRNDPLYSKISSRKLVE